MGYSSGLIVFYTSVYVFYGRINAEVSCGHVEPTYSEPIDEIQPAWVLRYRLDPIVGIPKLMLNLSAFG